MGNLTLFNRFREPFIGRFDGEEYRVPGAGRLVTTEVVARHLKHRSAITHNWVTGRREFQLAILEEDGQAVTPLTEIPVESIDRVDEDSFRDVTYLKLGGGHSVIPPREPNTTAALDARD